MQDEQKEGYFCNAFFLLSEQNTNISQEAKNSNLFT